MTNVKYLDAHNFYKKLLIEGLADPKSHRTFVDLINQWNSMVFPQAALEIIPDSQTPSADEGSTSNPKNPDVAEMLRLLSLGNNNAQSEMLGLLDKNHDGLLNNEFESYDDFNNYFDNSSTQGHPSSIPSPTPSPPLMPSTTSANLTPQVHEPISATSAHVLSATISATINTSTMLHSPANDPLPAPKKLTRTTNHHIVAVQEGQRSTDGPSEVCLR